jgi:ubiquinone/menaquinone biosynthesis C-methylase UbiE
MEPNKSEIKDKIRAFWDNPHQNYDALAAHGMHSETEKEMWLQGMTKLLGQEKNLKILDIGTGTGFLALLLAEMKYNVTGADWAASKIQQAKEKATSSNVAVQFQVQDAEKLSLESNTFDAVVSRHVIWTLSDPYAAAREWVRVAKPGGKVIVDIPRMGSHSGNHHFGEEIGKCLPFYNGADPEKIVEMLKEAGLSKIGTLMLETSGDEEKKTLLIYGEKLSGK